jgi:hypothetical protein
MQNTNKSKGKSKTKTNRELNSKLVAWFEIPVLNLERAINFYSEIFNIKFETITTVNHSMAFFPKDSGVGGALVYGDGCIPSQSGSLLYLNIQNDLEEALSRIASVGGQVIMGKTLLGDDVGHYSLVLDSEGNRVSLFTNN